MNVIQTSTAKTKPTNFRGQLPKNLISNILLFVFNVATGIWLVPYFIHNLGVGAYGMITLATSYTQYVALFTMAISGSVSRFLTIDLHREDKDRANRTFNTAFWSFLVVSLLILPVLMLVSMKAPVLFNVPEGLEQSTIMFFVLVSVSFLITSLSGYFGVSMFAHNRLDLRNSCNIIRIIVRIGSVCLLFSLLSPRLEFVSVSMLLSSVVYFALCVLFWRKLTPELLIKVKYFDRSRMKELLGMGGWMVVNHIGYLLFLQIDLIVVNRLFGADVTGEYASLLQWNSLFRGMAGVLAGVVAPMLMICYAQKRFDDLIRFSKLAVKFLGLGLALPLGLAFGLAHPLLELWLGSDFSHLAWLLQLMLCHLVVNLAVLPLFNINVCYNKIRIPGLVTLGMGGVNLVLALTLSKIGGLGVYGVALAGGIVLTLKNALFTPWYAARALKIRTSVLIREVLTPTVAFVAVISMTMILANVLTIDSWFRMVETGLAVSVLYGMLTLLLLVRKEEREIILSFFMKRLGQSNSD